jgi:translation initiation factor IF-2
MPEELVGTVTHFFKGPSVAMIHLSAGELAVGDRVHIHGHTTDFTAPITSMQVNHQPVERAQAEAEVAIQVSDRARPKDQVFKVS